MRDRRQPDVPAVLPGAVAGVAEALAQARERAGRGEQRRQCRRGPGGAGRPPRRDPARLAAARAAAGPRWPPRPSASPSPLASSAARRPRPRRRPRRRRSRPRSSAIGGRVPRGQRRARPRRRAAGRGRAGRGCGRVGARHSRVRLGRADLRASPSSSGGSPSAPGGPSTSPGGARAGPSSAGPQLERVEAVGRLARALARPRLDRVGGRVEQLVEALPLVGRERRQDVVDRAPRPGSPIPTRSRLNFSVPELVDDRAQAVVAARPAALAEPQLAERQREVVGDDEQVDERRVLAREDLAHREARVVHVGQRLDERQVEAAEAARRRLATRRAARPLPGPAGPIGEPVQHHPADVVARLRVLRARVPEADDDLHVDGDPRGRPAPRGHGERPRDRVRRARTHGTAGRAALAMGRPTCSNRRCHEAGGGASKSVAGRRGRGPRPDEEHSDGSPVIRAVPESSRRGRTPGVLLVVLMVTALLLRAASRAPHPGRRRHPRRPLDCVPDDLALADRLARGLDGPPGRAHRGVPPRSRPCGRAWPAWPPTRASGSRSRDGTPVAALAAGLRITPQVQFTTTAAGPDTVDVRPAKALTGGTVYRFAIDAADGTLLASWAVNVATPPRVNGTLPGNETSRIPVNTGIEIMFDEAGITADDMAGHFRISPAVTGRFEVAGRTVAFVPNALAANTLYTVTVTKGLPRRAPASPPSPTPSSGSRPATPRRRSSPSSPSAGRSGTPPPRSRPRSPSAWTGLGEEVEPVEATVALTVHQLASMDAAVAATRTLREAPDWTERTSTTPISTTGLTRVLVADTPLRAFASTWDHEDQPSDYWIQVPQVLPAGWYLVTLAHRGVSNTNCSPATTRRIVFSGRTLAEALKADVFFGLSKARATGPMGPGPWRPNPWVPAMANPIPRSRPRMRAPSGLTRSSAPGVPTTQPMCWAFPTSSARARCARFDHQRRHEDARARARQAARQDVPGPKWRRLIPANAGNRAPTTRADAVDPRLIWRAVGGGQGGDGFSVRARSRSPASHSCIAPAWEEPARSPAATLASRRLELVRANPPKRVVFARGRNKLSALRSPSGTRPTVLLIGSGRTASARPTRAMGLAAAADLQTHMCRTPTRPTPISSTRGMQRDGASRDRDCQRMGEHRIAISLPPGWSPAATPTPCLTGAHGNYFHRLLF